MSTRTVKLLEIDEVDRIATVDFGAAVPGTTGQLYAEYNRLKKPGHASVMLVTPSKPGTYIIQVASEGEFMNAVGYFVLAGVALLGWVRANTKVIETRPNGDRSWSLVGKYGLADWVLIQPK